VHPIGIMPTVTARLGRFWRRSPVITLTDAHDRAALAALAAVADAHARGDYAAAHRWADLGRRAAREARG
jgi:predicted N-acyltransferase